MSSSGPITTKPRPPLRFIDLFAGVGGFHHALSHPAFGGECVLAVEWDPSARLVYERAFPGLGDDGFVSDVRSITRLGDGQDAPVEAIDQAVPDHDVLCAGFPCQPFSKSGPQLGIRDQTRGTLFFDIMQIVRAKRPRYLILENVPNLAGPRHRPTWSLIIDSLRDAGYRVSSTPVLLSPHNLPERQGGSPQVRTRVFILAAYDPDHADEDEPPLVAKKPFEGFDPVTGWDIYEYLDVAAKAPEYELRPAEQTWLRAWDAFVKGIQSDDLPGFPIWVDAWQEEPDLRPDQPAWKQDFLRKNSAFYRLHRDFLDGWMDETWDSEGHTVLDFPRSRQKFEWQARAVHPTREGRTLWDLLIHLRPSGIRVKPPNYVPALVAITQTSIVGSLGRRITPREAAGLQQIPFEPFEVAQVPDADIYKQLGNAVNVGTVRYVARKLFARYGEEWGEAQDGADPVALPLWAGLPAS